MIFLLALFVASTEVVLCCADSGPGHRWLGVGFRRREQNGDILWECKSQFAFVKDGIIGGNAGQVYSGCFNSLVLCTYAFNQNPIYKKSIELEIASLGSEANLDCPDLIFRHSRRVQEIQKETHVMNLLILMKWEISNINSLKNVLDAIEVLRNRSGNFPKFNLAGYDYTYDALNCCGFSVKLLRSLGVRTNAYLDKYIDYRYDKGDMKAIGWLKNYNPVTFIAFAFDKSVGMRALKPSTTVEELLKTNSSDEDSNNVKRLIIHPRNIVVALGDLSGKLKVALESMRNQRESDWSSQKRIEWSG